MHHIAIMLFIFYWDKPFHGLHRTVQTSISRLQPFNFYKLVAKMPHIHNVNEKNSSPYSNALAGKKIKGILALSYTTSSNKTVSKRLLWSRKPTLLAHYHEMKWNDSRNVNSMALEDCLDDKRTISKCFMEGALLFCFRCNISGRGSPNRDWVATRIRDIDCQISCLCLCPCLSLSLFLSLSHFF